MENLVIHLLVLVFSVVFHEYAHGLAAYRLGDDTARLKGRLTMNPLNHIDPVGSLLVPVVLFITGGLMFGWAKPVPVRVGKLRNPRNDHPKVAAAGPAANLILALVSAVGLGLVSVAGVKAPGTGSVVSPVTFLGRLFMTGIQLNVMLAMFNLMPVPPLDGSWILSRLLPVGARLNYENLRQYGFLPVIVFLVLLQIPPLGPFFYGVLQQVLGLFINVTYSVMGLFL